MTRAPREHTLYGMTGALLRNAFSFTLLLLLAAAPARLGAQSAATRDTGKLIAEEKTPAGRPLPPQAAPLFTAALYELRDAVYNNAAPGEVERSAQALAGEAKVLGFDTIDEALILARIEYLAARSWNEAGDRQKAIPHFEAAIDQARRSMSSGEHAAGLMALTKPLSELSLIKGMPFLIANGPQVSKNAKKILLLEPGHIGALITLAAEKAYPPAIFGGNPKEAIAQMSALIEAHPEGFEKDQLFDIRVCVATAEARLKKKAEARFWFEAALELYPRNKYANQERERVKP